MKEPRSWMIGGASLSLEMENGRCGGGGGGDHGDARMSLDGRRRPSALASRLTLLLLC